MKNFSLPKFHKLVQIETLQELDGETRKFLDQHATRPIEEIDLEDTNDFLRASYYRFVEERQDELR